MSRSLFRRLQRRFGRPVSPSVRDRRLAAHRAALARLLPFRLITSALPGVPGRALRVAVIGGGFAGLAAANTLQNIGCTVALFEAREEVGGRVETTRTHITNRLLERGAELIGRNHHTWIDYAHHYGLGLSVLTTDDQYEGMRLTQPIRVGGRELSESQAQQLYASMSAAKDELNRLSQAITDDLLLEPWRVADASRLDSQTIQSWIRSRSSNPRLQAALEFEFANDMAVPTDRQSLLAILAQVAAGGHELYWEHTEVYRCEDGNQELARRMVRAMADPSSARPARPVRPVRFHLNERVEEINMRGGELHLRTSLPPGHPPPPSGPGDYVCDYAVLAVPPTVWRDIRVNGGPITTTPVQCGPAVKYLAPTQTRYWIHNRRAPSAVDTSFGAIWEGTDNQMGAGNIDVSVFAGGPLADAVTRGDHHTYFARGINRLLGGGSVRVYRGDYANWPATNHIGTGYSCPGPGEVTGAVRRLNETTLINKIYFAGEHVSPGFFGYMEGALQSGIRAAVRIAEDSRIRIPLG
jgi:monoamine oxidase